MNIDEELETARNIAERFHVEPLGLAETEPVERLVKEVKPKIASFSSDQALAEIFGMAAMHPNAHVRYYMLKVAEENAENVFAQEYLMSMSHDDEDYVAFAALRLLADLELQRCFDDLISFIGWPSERLKQPQGKVGVGGATVLETHARLLGTRDVEEVEELEAFFEEHGHLPQDRLKKPHRFVHVNPPADAEPTIAETPVDESTPDDMVLIPGGRYEIGIEQSELPVNRFDVSDFTHPYTVEIAPYFIDKYPVTNAKYDEFAAEIDDLDHKFCHPGEPEGKDHRRNTLHDDRVGPDHPVTGIDWYDAYAYAKWAGKDLPIDEEWEIAARGPSGNIFPWGDTFDPDWLNWAGQSFGVEVDDWEEWQEILLTADRMAERPECITTPVDAFPEGASEFGVVDMVGNVWEYTKTNFYTRQELFPVFSHKKRKAHEHLIEGVDAFPTTRGGAWSSIPEMTSAVYRSSDLMTDRHNEIGFRCVKRVLE